MLFKPRYCPPRLGGTSGVEGGYLDVDNYYIIAKIMMVLMAAISAS